MGLIYVFGCRNGQLREYIIPEISKEDLRARLRAVLEDGGAHSQPSSSQTAQTETGNDAGTVPAASTAQPESASMVQSAAPAPQVTQSQPQPAPATDETKTTRDEPERAKKPSTGSAQKPATPSQASWQKPQQRKEEDHTIGQTKQTDKKPSQQRKAAPENPSISKANVTEVRPKPAPTPPKQYRLQVRLFDGSSVRSSFGPSQTIRKDVRPWLDHKMGDEKHPYNLKHILTPLPNRTLTIADEEQTLQELLSLGASANLVMVPIKTYTEAYTGSRSLPVRAVSTAYDLASSTVGAAAGFVGSLFGFGQTTASEGPPATESSASGGDARRAAPVRLAASRGPNIRTLSDQRREQGDSQFYNGNQVCLSNRNLSYN